ncbi:MAG: beta galactosidase jelly roll domain-containing protein, partial [Muribaculaceae bacterium]|nr:beta galactosidase jelly roll domain-containing protein [Muribaculaceae bacterium]
MKKVIIPVLALAAAAFANVSAAERQLFDSDWKFAFGNASDPAKDFGCGTEYFNYLTKANSIHNEGPYSPKFNPERWGAEWIDVTLPHDWVVDLPFEQKASHSHGYKTVGYKYPETSVGWYRKTFFVPEEDYGKHISLQFDGIFRDARVWVNGFYLGSEPSGYATQVYDISEYLNYGGENVVAVRADATLEEGWFYEGAGIYRHVWLDKADPLHVAPFGTFVHAALEAPFDEAVVTVETTVDNMGLDTAAYAIRNTLIAPDGTRTVLPVATEKDVLPKSRRLSTVNATVASPAL